MATIPSGVTSRGLVINGEEVYVYGTARYFTLNYNAWMDVCSGGVAYATNINNGGALVVSSGGHVYDTTVNRGGSAYVVNKESQIMNWWLTREN